MCGGLVCYCCALPVVAEDRLFLALAAPADLHSLPSVPPAPGSEGPSDVLGLGRLAGSARGCAIASVYHLVYQGFELGALQVGRVEQEWVAVVLLASLFNVLVELRLPGLPQVRHPLGHLPLAPVVALRGDCGRFASGIPLVEALPLPGVRKRVVLRVLPAMGKAVNNGSHLLWACCLPVDRLDVRLVEIRRRVVAPEVVPNGGPWRKRGAQDLPRHERHLGRRRMYVRSPQHQVVPRRHAVRRLAVLDAHVRRTQIVPREFVVFARCDVVAHPLVTQHEVPVGFDVQVVPRVQPVQLCPGQQHVRVGVQVGIEARPLVDVGDHRRVEQRHPGRPAVKLLRLQHVQQHRGPLAVADELAVVPVFVLAKVALDGGARLHISVRPLDGVAAKQAKVEDGVQVVQRGYRCLVCVLTPVDARR